MHGTVDRIRGKGAFCFLKTPDGDLFAHKNSFLDPEAMLPRQKVTFEVIVTPRGKEAMNVRTLQ